MFLHLDWSPPEAHTCLYKVPEFAVCNMLFASSTGSALGRVSVSPPAGADGAGAGGFGAAGVSEGGAGETQGLSVRPAGTLHSPPLSASAGALVRPAATPAHLLQPAGYPHTHTLHLK